MWPYFAMFFAAVSGVAVSDPDRRRNPAIWLGFGIILALLIGFRFRVGGDWGFEHHLFWRVNGLSFFNAVKEADPGFAIIAWLFADSGFNVWTLNLFCGSIFTVGLLSFCLKQPDPWLTVAVSIPYLVIVVAMGYSRQSVAIGFFLLALVQLEARSLVGFLVFMALAASMHITAAMLAPICVLVSRRRKLKTLIIGVPVALALFIYLLQDSVDAFVAGYIDAEYQSSGALVRVMMNAVPAALYLLTRPKFCLSTDTSRLWSTLSLIALAFIPLLAISPSSTAVDRMALYFIPVQLFVLGRLPRAWARSASRSEFWDARSDDGRQ